ncbi:fimbrial-like protein [Enterobacter sp. V87_3]|uniref:fimbrial-like protein n=1 Tax=Enterobacter sp. V87_3 TaxID=3044236 RepID=UPI0032B713A9
MFIKTGSLNRMFHSRIIFKSAVPWLAFCLGFPAAGFASSLEMEMTANIINNTCQVSIPDNGKVILPIVGRDWFYNSDGSPRLQPGDAAGGTRFEIQLKSCAESESGLAKTLHFEFKPQSGKFTESSQQVFANEIPDAGGGAENVGIVIFSEKDNTNVVNTSGTSNVIFDVSDQTESQYLTNYNFYARYQSTGIVSAGKVITSVLVNVIYN